jgi:hypothetical protein
MQNYCGAKMTPEKETELRDKLNKAKELTTRINSLEKIGSILTLPRRIKVGIYDAGPSENNNQVLTEIQQASTIDDILQGIRCVIKALQDEYAGLE